MDNNMFINVTVQMNYYPVGIVTWNHVIVYKATLVKGDLKVPFSIATTPRCRGGRYSIPWIAPLNPWSSPYNAEC